MADYKSDKPEIKQNKTEKKSRFNLQVKDEKESVEFISDKTVLQEVIKTELEQPSSEQKTQPQKDQSITKKIYRIVLVSPSYIVLDNNGNNQFVHGDFKDKKVGDMIELDLLNQ